MVMELHMTEIQKYLIFIEEVGKLKLIDRTGWKMMGISNPESVAEHSYRVSVLAMVISDLMGLNTEKIIKMSLIHDISESRIGDIDFIANKYIDVKNSEEKAISDIFSNLPDALERKYIEIWKEFDEGLTIESKIVNQLDKLEMLIQAYEYETYGYKKLDEFWENWKNFDGIIKEIFELYKSKRLLK